MALLSYDNFSSTTQNTPSNQYKPLTILSPAIKVPTSEYQSNWWQVEVSKGVGNVDNIEIMVTKFWKYVMNGTSTLSIIVRHGVKTLFPLLSNMWSNVIITEGSSRIIRFWFDLHSSEYITIGGNFFFYIFTISHK